MGNLVNQHAVRRRFTPAVGIGGPSMLDKDRFSAISPHAFAFQEDTARAHEVPQLANER
jgi:hypothetical protein